MHVQLSPPFSHTFTLSPFFLTFSVASTHFQFSPSFSHTHSVTYLFFPLSVVSPFFSHIFSSLLFFLIHVQLSPLFSQNKTLSVVSLFLTHLQFSVISNCFSHFQFSPFFLTHSVASFFLKHIRLPSPFKKI